MLGTEATWLAFAAFSGLRTISYVPQIIRIAKDHSGASAISYPTWLLWTGAHVTTAMYAATNLNDTWLAFASSIYAVCCIVVIALTAIKRLAHRRTKTMSSCGDEGTNLWARPRRLGRQATAGTRAGALTQHNYPGGHPAQSAEQLRVAMCR
jgi:hypothetical protein